MLLTNGGPMQAPAGVGQIEPKATRSFFMRGFGRESARGELVDARLEVETQLIVHLRFDDTAATQPEMKERPDTRPYLARHRRGDYTVRGSRMDTTVRA